MLVMERTMGMTFGEVVRRRRMELGLTQEELGMRLKRDATRVSKVESGHTFRRMPSPEEFMEWTEALEINPAIVLEMMGYTRKEEDSIERTPDLVFTSLADEVRYSDNIGPDEREAILDGIKHAQRMWELRARR